MAAVRPVNRRPLWGKCPSSPGRGHLFCSAQVAAVTLLLEGAEARDRLAHFSVPLHATPGMSLIQSPSRQANIEHGRSGGVIVQPQPRPQGRIAMLLLNEETRN